MAEEMKVKDVFELMDTLEKEGWAPMPLYCPENGEYLFAVKGTKAITMIVHETPLDIEKHNKLSFYLEDMPADDAENYLDEFADRPWKKQREQVERSVRLHWESENAVIHDFVYHAWNNIKDASFAEGLAFLQALAKDKVYSSVADIIGLTVTEDSFIDWNWHGGVQVVALGVLERTSRTLIYFQTDEALLPDEDTLKNFRKNHATAVGHWHIN